MFLKKLVVNKHIKRKEKFADHQFHNIWGLFDVLPNFPFTKSVTIADYCLETWYIGVASRVSGRLKTLDLRKFENIKKVSKLHRMIAQCSVLLLK